MMQSIDELLASKLTAKKKAKAIGAELLAGTVQPSSLLKKNQSLPEPQLAIVIEALEGATRKKPELVDRKAFAHLVDCLSHAAPRVKWEAARTISNVAALHIDHLEPAVDALLDNSSNESTVVRWATAQALAAIVRAGHGGDALRARVRKIATKEQDDGVRKVYERLK